MKAINLLLIPILALAVCFPTAGIGDQTDQRLEQLFETLRGSRDEQVLREAEAAIWDIWYESGEETVDQLMLQGAELMDRGNLAAAEEIYSRVIELLPGFSEGWNRRATVRYYRSDYDGSLADIEETLRLEPRHFGAIWGLGMILGSKRDYQRAILAFERLLEIKPNAADAPVRIELLKRELARQSV
jgi:tetratricopeptide (TPR) repeat protein